jgi:hypothetical protein
VQGLAAAAEARGVAGRWRGGKENKLDFWGDEGTGEGGGIYPP